MTDFLFKSLIGVGKLIDVRIVNNTRNWIKQLTKTPFMQEIYKNKDLLFLNRKKLQNEKLP